MIDHYVPEADDESRRIVRIARDWAREQALPHVYDSMGICHVVLPQHGHIRPGMFCVGGDSHSPTGGAFGAYMFGIGSHRDAGRAGHRRDLGAGAADHLHALERAPGDGRDAPRT